MKYIESDHIKLNAEMNKVIWLDQTKLPNEEIFIESDNLERMYDAIKLLEVRGAPCIGIFAAYAFAVLYKRAVVENVTDIDEYIKKAADYLNSSRPTAVNLSWALKRMEDSLLELNSSGLEREEIGNRLIDIAVSIHEEDINMCKTIGEYGVTLIKDGDGILTHCNAGRLATSRYGTALAPIYVGVEQGMKLSVYSDETRPLLQGARLTSYELYKAGIDVTLICDNMASIVMKQGKINAVFVGCDRVAANGDAANKIGTSGVAILAKHYGIPFYVLGPYSTIDMSTRTGADIVIEERKQSEIREMFYEAPKALEGVKCYNPAFDVTDHELITAFVTDKGIIYPPFDENFAKIFS